MQKATVEPFIQGVVDQHFEDAASLWTIRDSAVARPPFHFSDHLKLDERIEANLDGLRTAETDGWSIPPDDYAASGAGEFFVAGVLSAESDDVDRLGLVIERAYARAAQMSGEPYHPAYDPWRGLVSALAWVGRRHAVRLIGWLLDTPRPRTRWLGVAACGARRSVHQPGLETALADTEPIVRARAARTIGELGRGDLRGQLSALHTDPDDDCRFWAAWSTARLGSPKSFDRLQEFAYSPGPWSERALELLMRCLPTDQARGILRTIAGDPSRRRAVIRATGAIGDALYIPWLISQASEPIVARLACNTFVTITGAPISTLSGEPPSGFQSALNDDPDDENVALPEDEGLAWPDMEKLKEWWTENSARFIPNTPYFLGAPKQSLNWITILSEGAQEQRRAASLELALRNPQQAMFEVRARADVQRQQLQSVGGGH